MLFFQIKAVHLQHFITEINTKKPMDFTMPARWFLSPNKVDTGNAADISVTAMLFKWCLNSQSKHNENDCLVQSFYSTGSLTALTSQI